MYGPIRSSPELLTTSTLEPRPSGAAAAQIYPHGDMPSLEKIATQAIERKELTTI
jgi:hypothetical protein